MPLFDFSKDERANIRGIKKRVLRMIMEASKDSIPNEFGAMLRARSGVIEELILVPGTESGERSALFKLHMLPIDSSIVGTVHSHPSGVYYPSGADLDLFRKYGWVHIIVGSPFSMTSWACFDMSGEERDLEIVD